jgi:hypothetical protein
MGRDSPGIPGYQRRPKPAQHPKAAAKSSDYISGNEGMTNFF